MVSSSTPIWLDDVACAPDGISNLRLCSHEGTGEHNCAHSEDIILSCLQGKVQGKVALQLLWWNL